MTGHSTRRGFLRATAAAGGALVLPRLHAVAGAEQSGTVTDEDPGGVRMSPITVVTQAVSRDVNPRASAWAYVTEILQHAGLFFDQIAPADLPSLLGRAKPIVLLVGDLSLTSADREFLTAMVERGGSLIGCGGTSGLDKVFGVSGKRPLMEGWMKPTVQGHRVCSGLRSSLHVFGGFAVTPGSATSLADIDSGAQAAKGSAIVENRVGRGHAVLLAPDLVFSIVHIQQGVSVLQDGKPATDGTAALNDGELKAEDGMVLDWQRDRTPMDADGEPVFLEPISDELREIVLRCIFHVAATQRITLPMLWYWPRGLKSVGHLSHDTDGNDPEKGVALLEVVNRFNLKSTWCTLYPGGYPRKFYHTLDQQGFEIALHYDARTGGADTSWSKDNFLLQHDWLKKEADIKHITSNKNHYTRWESRLDFLRWCEEAGIDSDQTRGPSKKGTIGFPLGGSQPYFPIDDEADHPRLLDVLEINMLTQDLKVVCPPEYGRQLVDSVVRNYGVAHFLFHPAHIEKPGVADAFRDVVQYGRAQGLEWWTGEQIHAWEKRRRSVAASFRPGNRFVLRGATPLRQATLLMLNPGVEAAPGFIEINGQLVGGDRWTVYGFEFDAVPVDLVGEVSVRCV